MTITTSTVASTEPAIVDSPSPAMPVAAHWVAAVLLGAAVGSATAILQTYLDSPWASLANAASPWLAAAFAVGALQRRMPAAAVAGLVACVFELVGYYGTDAIRGYPASHTELVFWAATAVVGGPVLGVAGWSWWRGPERYRGLGAAVLAAAFLAEAAVSFGWRLHYLSTALLFAGIGVIVVVLLGRRNHDQLRITGWLGVVLPIGIVAEVVLDLAYRQSF
jgi:hypothetical protein